MILYFLRHASAGKHHMNPAKDELRPLDEEGILQTRYLGRLLANLDIQVETIACSPLRRAMQTASLVANELAYEHPLKIEEALRPEATWEQFQEMLADLRKAESLILVGHNPSMTEFLSRTISEKGAASQIDFKKGAVAKVETNGRLGRLDWLITPKIARCLQTGLKTSSRPKTSRK
jgi:phosphohistidine phosphatase